MKQVPKLEILPIDTLTPYANNARTHSDDQIKKIQASLREFGFVNPVLIDANRGIIAGHGRIEAAKREGISLETDGSSSAKAMRRQQTSPSSAPMRSSTRLATGLAARM